MRKSILPLVFLVAFGATGAAFAEETVGQIQSVDQAAMTVTLNDGSVYRFGNSQDAMTMLGGFRAGDKVQIVWTDANGVRSAQVVKAAE